MHLNIPAFLFLLRVQLWPWTCEKGACFELISAAPQSVPCGSFSIGVEQICEPKEPLKYTK